MPILVDFSQICITTVFQQIDSKGNLRNRESWLLREEGIDQSALSPELMRHVLLNNILFFKKKFAREFGEFIFCVDSKNSWRKQIFKHYKSTRKKTKDESPVDWDMIYDFMNDFKDELREVFDYKVVTVKSAEADDVIAVLCKLLHLESKILIISSDKDFLQLQRYSNISQYSINKKDFLETDKPREFLFDHIIRGDQSDGIPNIFSPNDSYETRTKCKPVMTKKVEKWLKIGNPSKISEWDEKIMKRFRQNRKLIDFDQIPQGIVDRIMSTYEDVCSGLIGSKKSFKKSSVFTDYFVNNGLNRLMEVMSDF